MKILCIDVGIKTLSLCIMKKTEILLWDVWSVLEEQEICNQKTKSGKICNKNALYKDNSCGIHYKGGNKKKDKIKKVCIKNLTLQDITKKVLEKIQEIIDKNTETFKDVSLISIELQPKINQKMKLISHILFGKFVDFTRKTECKVRFISGNKKLKLKHRNKFEVKSNTYTNRKKMCILLCKYYIQNEEIKDKEKWLKVFEDCKKKDDMADSFCYCIYIFEKEIDK